METLKSLLKKHPEWANLPIGIYRSDGNVDFVGCSGLVYICKHKEEGKEEDILIFSGN